MITAAAVAATVVAGAAQQKERSAVPDKYKWDLTQIYPNDQAWRAAKDKLTGELPAVRAFRGTLGSSAAKLADALELSSRLAKDFTRLYVYASMMSDQDTKVTQGMQQRWQAVRRSAPKRHYGTGDSRRSVEGRLFVAASRG